jgi:hypothetical protein
MNVLWLALGVSLLWATSSEAACLNNGGGVWTVSALNASEMNACISAASSGDTINVPAGSASWSISLPGNKDLNIVGATVVTCSGTAGTSGYSCSAGATTTTITGSPAFTINLASSHTLSGFIFTGGSGERISSTGDQSVNKHFRIHHNVLISTAGWQPIRFHGGSNGVHPQGIWDHNRIQNGVAIHTNGTFDQLDEGNVQHVIWAENTPLGDSTKVVYLEDNYFVTSAGTTNFGDGNYAGRSVIRFNTTSGPAITAWEYHSPQSANRGYQRWENYGNHHINLDSADTCYFGMHSIRGGTGVAFDNAMTGAVSGCNQSISLDNVRSEDDAGAGVGRCDGSSGWDQNLSGQQGWHCRDQIGISRDLTQWDNSPAQTWNQELKPAYLWGNTRSGAYITATVASGGLNRSHIQANRDYYDHSTATGSPQSVGVQSGPVSNRPAACTTGVAYWATDEGEWNARNDSSPDGRLYKCTSTNTWTLYYTPYAYPHPWTTGGSGGGDVTPPSAPTNLRISS